LYVPRGTVLTDEVSCGCTDGKCEGRGWYQGKHKMQYCTCKVGEDLKRSAVKQTRIMERGFRGRRWR